MTGFARRIWKWLAAIFAGLAILLALLIGAFRIVVAQAPDYRQPIADLVSGFLGLPVQISRLDARFGLGGPELVLAGATVLSADGSEALFSASEATLSLDVSELLFRWRLAADTFTLDDLTLELERSETGEMRVFNRRLDEFPRSETPKISELRIRNATVKIRDRMAEGREWRLTDVEALLSQRGEETRVEGRFTPPPGIAEDGSFWAAKAVQGPWRTYAGVRGLSLAGLSQIPSVPVAVPRSGTGDLRLWIDLQENAVDRVSAQIELRDLSLSPEEVESEPFAELAGRLEWDRLANGWRGRIQDLVVGRGGSRWSSAQLMIERRGAGSGQEGDFFLDADFIRLDDLRPFVPLVPDEATRDALAAMQLSGDVTGLTAHLAVVDREARGFQIEASAELSNVDMQPYGKLPGIRGLSGRMRSDPKGGRIELDSRNCAVTFEELFRDPLEFDTATGLIVWSRGSDGLTIIGDGLTADNRDLGLEAGFRLRLPGTDEPGRIDVQATATNVDLATTSRYLPVGIMSPKVVGWLDTAIVSGRVPEARLELAGPTKGFPYPGGEGVFEVSFAAQDLALDYARDWPSATDISADILFRGPGLFADIRKGRLGGAVVDDLRLEIPVLREGMLSIRGTAQGPLEAVKSYVLESPLRAVIGEAMSNTRIYKGDTDIGVDILLPLNDLSGRDVLVELGIDDARLEYGGVTHPLESVTGKISIHNNEVRGQDISGVFLGEPAFIDIAPHGGGGTRAHVASTMTSDALVDVLGLPLADYLEGQTPWTGFAHFPAADSGELFWIRLESDMRGLAFELPHPVAKPVTEALPLSIDFEFPEPGVTEWSAVYGDRFSAKARFATGDDGLDFLAANILLGSRDARIGQEKGLVIQGAVDYVPVLEWLGVRFGDQGEGRLEDLLTRIDIRAGRATFGGNQFSQVEARLQQTENQWLLELGGPDIAGELTFPLDFSSGTPFSLEMDRLYLVDAEEPGEKEALDPRKIPSMDIVAEDFRLTGLKMGRLEATIRSVPNGFRLERYTMTGPSHVIEGDGRSFLGFGQDESALTLSASTSDLGAAMEYMGFERSVESPSAEFRFDLDWTGGLPPELLEVATGTGRLEIKSGNLTQVKPGAGRVFGLLSVQALPRRLTLDFRDVFKKGFFFDEFRGDFAIAEGKAYTDNLVFRSPAADIGIVGYVDLTDRLYDQTAIVSAEVGNTLPVVGAIAAGPAIGAGLFVLKEIFKEPLRGMVNVQYRITGPWDEPDVVKVAAASGETDAVKEAPGEARQDSTRPGEEG